MKLLREKFVYAGIIGVVIMLVILSLSFSQSYHPTPKEMPVAVVVADKGLDFPGKGQVNAGQTMADNIMAKINEQAEPPVKLTLISSEQEAMEALNDNKYYAAFIFPEDFSTKQASLQSTTPVSPEIKIIVNQGKNATASTAVTQLLSQLVDTMNTQIRTQTFAAIKQQGNGLTTEQAELFYAPITKNIVNVNPSGVNNSGAAPAMLTNPVWIVSLIFALMVYQLSKKQSFINKKEKAGIITEKIAIGILFAFLIGFTAPGIASVLGMEIPNFAQTGLFLAITAFSFYLLIECVLEWLGMPGFFLFPVIMFIGLPILALPVEFIPEFPQNFIYPWLPQRFSLGGLQQIMFFGKGVFNIYTGTLLLIAAAAMVIMYASVIRVRHKDRASTQ